MRKFVLISSMALSLTLSSYLQAEVKSGLAALEKQDFKLAAAEFSKAYESGDGEGAFLLGRMFEFGVGIDKDQRKAAAHYQAAIEKGSHKAQNRLGVMFLKGEGVLQDYTKSFELICDAAKSGDSNAQFNCGHMFEKGQGTEIKLSEAAKQYEKAAKNKHIGAINALAALNSNKDYKKANPETAFELYTQAANMGNAFAMFKRGQMAELGLGIKQYMALAHASYNLSALGGYDEAAAARDELTEKLDHKALTKAHKIAREWKPVEANNSLN